MIKMNDVEFIINNWSKITPETKQMLIKIGIRPESYDEAATKSAQ